MAATRTTLKQYFKKYATPTEEQFAALIDAFVHKDEDSLTQSKIDGLTAALESKVSSSDLASAVATAVGETLQGGNIEVTPAAHQHAIADVEGLQTFVTKVNNFLESADVSDETINRWVEIETFLTGITDQETLAGLLLNLKNEILAQIPEPQTGNYLKQISDLDAYTEAQEGEIVQYVGSTTENYTRALCYEWKGSSGWITKELPIYSFNNCPALRLSYHYTPSYTRVLCPPNGNEIIAANNLIVPKIYSVNYSGEVSYGLYWNKNVVKDLNADLLTIGDYVITVPFNTVGERNNKYMIYNGKLWYQPPNIPDVDMTDSVEFHDEAAVDYLCIKESATSSLLYTCIKIPNTSYGFFDQVCVGKYSRTMFQPVTITELNETENFNKNLNVLEYKIGGWQPIATSPVVS